MNRDMRNFEHLVDQWGRPVVWRGKWKFENPYGGVAYDENIVEPITFPRTYFKTDQIDTLIERARKQYRPALDVLAGR